MSEQQDIDEKMRERLKQQIERDKELKVEIRDLTVHAMGAWISGKVDEVAKADGVVLTPEERKRIIDHMMQQTTEQQETYGPVVEDMNVVDFHRAPPYEGSGGSQQKGRPFKPPFMSWGPGTVSKVRRKFPDYMADRARARVTEQFAEHRCTRVGPMAWDFKREGSSYLFMAIRFERGLVQVSGDVESFAVGRFDIGMGPNRAERLADFLLDINLDYFNSKVEGRHGKNNYSARRTKQHIYEYLTELLEDNGIDREDCDTAEDFQKELARIKALRKKAYAQLRHMPWDDPGELQTALCDLEIGTGGGDEQPWRVYNDAWEMMCDGDIWEGDYVWHYLGLQMAMRQFLDSGAARCKMKCMPCTLCGGTEPKDVVAIHPAGEGGWMYLPPADVLDTMKNLADGDDEYEVVAKFAKMTGKELEALPEMEW